MVNYNHDNWGEPERAPHKRYFNARSVYIIIMVRPSPARRFIDSVLRPHAMFSAEKSAWLKTTATLCSNIAHSAYNNISLVVS